MPQNTSPIGSAEELQIALDETIERLRGISKELVTLEMVACEVVNAWQGQGNLNLTMARLAHLLSDKDSMRKIEGAPLAH